MEAFWYGQINHSSNSHFSDVLTIFPEKIKEDNQARIVYLLTISGRASRQVRRLIKQLYDGKNYFYIHVDSRQDYLYRDMKALESMFPDNIYVTPNRWATIWGGASLLSMLTGCFKDLLQRDWKWDFVLNLSESQYPLKKREDLIEFLSNNKDKNFVKSHGREPAEFIRKQGKFIKRQGKSIKHF